MDGPVRSFETEDGRVRLTFPGAHIERSSGTRTLLGDLVVWITPKDQVRYDVLVDWPARMEVRGKSGELRSVLTTGEGRVAGEWRADLHTISRLDLRLHDINMTGPDAFSLGSLALYIDGGDATGGGPLDLRLALDGFAAAHAGVPAEYVPDRLRLTAEIVDLPLGRLLDAAMMNGAAPQTDPASEGNLMALLIEAGTRLRLTDMTLGNSDSNLRATGDLAAERIAAQGLIGRFDVELAGLDRILQRAARSKGERGAADVLTVLAVLKVLGHRTVAADQAVAYRYAVEIPPSGVVTVNSLPLDILRSGEARRAAERN